MIGKIKKAIATAAVIVSTGLASLLPFHNSQASDWTFGIEPSVGYSNYRIKVPESARNVSITGNTGYYDLPILRSYDLVLSDSADYQSLDIGAKLFFGLDSSNPLKNFKIGKRFSLDLEKAIGYDGTYPGHVSANLDMTTENIVSFEKALWIWHGEDYIKGGEDPNEGFKLSLIGEFNKHKYDIKVATYRTPYGNEWYMPADDVKTSEKNVASGKAYSSLYGLKFGAWNKEGEGFLEALTSAGSKDDKGSWAIRLGGAFKF